MCLVATELQGWVGAGLGTLCPPSHTQPRRKRPRDVSLFLGLQNLS